MRSSPDAVPVEYLLNREKLEKLLIFETLHIKKMPGGIYQHFGSNFDSDFCMVKLPSTVGFVHFFDKL